MIFYEKIQTQAQTPAVFPAAGSQVQFCLANVDPAGNATDGISRYATSQNFDQNELSIKSETTWKPTEYLNVWVAPDIDALGYAYLPSPTSLPGEDEDGAVILTSAFGGPGSGAESPFDLGRTLTHEVGHYLGLDHIWGEGCNIDDGIADTPDQAEENSGCQTHPSPSCNNQGDMFMNYMDYSDDHCLNAFTAGQANYMRQILQTSRAALVTTGRSSCSSDPIDPTVPTCDDGIKNGLETGIDCGGPNCTPCENSVAADAGLTTLEVNLTDEDCGGRAEFTATLQNFGSSRLTRVTLELSSNGGVLKTIEWSGSLAGGEYEQVSFGIVQVTTGEHNIMASSSNPNGQTDENASNDAVGTTFQSSGGSKLLLSIQPDDYGSEISWRIKDEMGSVVAKGQGYEDFNNDLIEESFCLPDGCYRLIFRDAYGDGICCDYGEGNYILQGSDGQALIESDGYYGTRETNWFCIENQSFNRQKIEREPRSNLPVKIKEVSKRPHLSSN